MTTTHTQPQQQPQPANGICPDCERQHIPGLICPECHEPVMERPPTKWHWAWGPTPQYSHYPDGEPLCPVIGDDGYEPAQPVDHHLGALPGQVEP